MTKIYYSCDVSLGSDGQYHKCLNDIYTGWIDRFSGLNHNYSIDIRRGRPHRVSIYLSLHNYMAKDILVYSEKEKYLKDLYKNVEQLIPILDKNLLLEKQIHEWKQQHISYYFDKDFNIIGHGYNNLIINQFNMDHDTHEFLYNYYNENPLKDINKLKYEYYPKNEYLWIYHIDSWGYSASGTPDNELKRICKQKIIEIKG